MIVIGVKAVVETQLYTQQLLLWAVAQEQKYVRQAYVSWAGAEMSCAGAVMSWVGGNDELGRGSNELP